MTPFVNYHLRCSRCGKSFEPDRHRLLCDNCPTLSVDGLRVCRGLLEVVYDLDALSRRINRRTFGVGAGVYPGVWRYRALLPGIEDEHMVTMGEGGTPFLPARRLGPTIGLPGLRLKVEAVNPTGAFKDRESAVCLSVGRALGARTAACASTGSIAVSLAAYAPRAGMRAVVFVPASTSPEKLVSILIAGAQVVPIRGIYERALAIEAQACEAFDWYDVSSAVNPYRAEGDKTTAFEIAEALDWQLPDWVVVPTGGGGHIAGLWKGFSELHALGFVRTLPRMASVGVEAGAPLAHAFRAGLEEVEPVAVTETVAGALLSAYADYGLLALRAVRASGGVALAVSDGELLEAQRQLAETEGVFAEVSSVAGIAGARRLVREGIVEPGQSVVCLVTGHGLREATTALRQVTVPAPLDDDWHLVRAHLEANHKTGQRGRD